MLPPVDTHVHLLAGLDDGPRDLDEAIAMCRMLANDGVRLAVALAHQNETYPDNKPQRLRDAAAQLMAELKARNIPLTLVPAGEVMLTPDLIERFDAGQLLTMADRGKFLLVEMPHALFIDITPIAKALRQRGVRLIIAHAERYPELLHGGPLVEQWIGLGCLIQVTAQEFAKPQIADLKILRDWVRRGIVHMLGTDGHRLDMRPPQMAAGVAALRAIAGPAAADRIANLWASAVLQGRNVNPPSPMPARKSWLAKLFGD